MGADRARERRHRHANPKSRERSGAPAPAVGPVHNTAIPCSKAQLEERSGYGLNSLPEIMACQTYGTIYQCFPTRCQSKRRAQCLSH